MLGNKSCTGWPCLYEIAIGFRCNKTISVRVISHANFATTGWLFIKISFPFPTIAIFNFAPAHLWYRCFIKNNSRHSDSIKILSLVYANGIMWQIELLWEHSNNKKNYVNTPKLLSIWWSTSTNNIYSLIQSSRHTLPHRNFMAIVA